MTFDNLATGWRDSVKFGPFEEGDLADRARLDEVFARWRPAAVMHFAEISLVGDAMVQGFATADAREMLEPAFVRLQECGCPVLPVLDDGRLVGLLTADNVGEFLMIRGALAKR